MQSGLVVMDALHCNLAVRYTATDSRVIFSTTTVTSSLGGMPTLAAEYSEVEISSRHLQQCPFNRASGNLFIREVHREFDRNRSGFLAEPPKFFSAYTRPRFPNNQTIPFIL